MQCGTASACRVARVTSPSATASACTTWEADAHGRSRRHVWAPHLSLIPSCPAAPQVEELERRANLATDYELERRRLRILSHLSDHYHSLGPQLKDMGMYITELKAYLQSVYDAELMGDSVLQVRG